MTRPAQSCCQQVDEQELPAFVFFKAGGTTGGSNEGRNLLERLIYYQQAVLAFALKKVSPSGIIRLKGIAPTARLRSTKVK